MAFTPKIIGSFTITSKDINNNSVAKTYNNPLFVNLDFAKGMINIVDNVQGSFYFSLAAATTVTYTANTASTPVVHTIAIT